VRSVDPWAYRFFGCCALAMTMTGLFRRRQRWRHAAFRWAFNGSCIVMTTNGRAPLDFLLTRASCQSYKKGQKMPRLVEQFAVLSFTHTSKTQRIPFHLEVYKTRYMHFCTGSTKNYNWSCKMRVMWRYSFFTTLSATVPRCRICTKSTYGTSESRVLTKQKKLSCRQENWNSPRVENWVPGHLNSKVMS
jgi:hypothetical protein